MPTCLMQANVVHCTGLGLRGASEGRRFGGHEPPIPSQWHFQATNSGHTLGFEQLPEFCEALLGTHPHWWMFCW